MLLICQNCNTAQIFVRRVGQAVSPAFFDLAHFTTYCTFTVIWLLVIALCVTVNGIVPLTPAGMVTLI